MSKDLVKKETNAVATKADLAGDWGFQGDPSDILIPRILIGQSTSKAVQDEKLAFGQLFRSTTNEILGGKGKPFSFIPLYMTKTWVISEKKGGRFEFRSIEPFTADNKDLPWTWIDRNIEWKREQSLNFFVLLPSDVGRDLSARRALIEKGEIPDLDASLLPCVLSFKSSSFKAGKILVTHFAKASDFNIPPYVNVFKLDSEVKQNDTGAKFYVMTIEKEGKTDPAMLPVCKKWRETVSQQAIKVDEPDHEETTHSQPESKSYTSMSGDKISV